MDRFMLAVLWWEPQTVSSVPIQAEDFYMIWSKSLQEYLRVTAHCHAMCRRDSSEQCVWTNSMQRQQAEWGKNSQDSPLQSINLNCQGSCAAQADCFTNITFQILELRTKHDQLQRGRSFWFYGLPSATSFTGQFCMCPQVVQ